jgi:hypothetical protein
MVKKQVAAQESIDKVIALCNEMIELADLGEDFYLNNDSSVFYGAVRDSAYKIRRLAKNEIVRHESGRQPSS